MRRLVTMGEPVYIVRPDAMFRYLDRAAIAEAKERKFRKSIRRIHHRRLRKFALALKRVMIDIPGPEIYIRKKVCSRCKISTATYYLSLRKLEKIMV